MRYLTLTTLLASTLLLTACFPNYFEPTVESWQGASFTRLVRAWGYPDGSETLPDGTKAYFYSFANTYHQSGTYWPGYHGSVGTYSPGYNVHHRCKVWFDVDKHGIIRNVQSRGNHCMIYNRQQAMRYGNRANLPMLAKPT